MRRLLSALVLVGALIPAVSAVDPSALADSTNASAQVTYTSSTETLQNLGTVNLTAAASAPVSPGPSQSPKRTVPLGRPPRAGATGKPVARGSFSVQKGNVADAVGFDGITGPQQAAVNGGANVGDLEPPDQGTCAGPDANGTPIAMEIINNAVAAYTTSGTQELGVTTTYALFKQPSRAALFDPRCYYDSSTQRWFFTEFVIGNPAPSTQFIAVSQTADPLGNYQVFGIDTTDTANPAGGCPCFGDFDQIGADANGFYIATNEFSAAGPPFFFDGTVMYALSKQDLEAAATGGSLPTVARYQITGDAFGSGNGAGPYHVSPASTPPAGSYAPDTEYFVESNSIAIGDNHLIVYALTGTNTLATLTAGETTPALEATLITSEAYSFPPNATQPPGPIPYGNSVGETTVSTLQPDFNAVQEVTYTGATLYAELDTSAGTPSSPTDGTAWFTLSPSLGSGRVSAQVMKQGYVASSQNFLYPDIVVDSSGNGFMIFTVSGTAEYPSAGYVTFKANAGPVGTVHIAHGGAAPEDGLTCYPASAGGCHWGDYSGGAVWDGRAYLMTEYIPATPRDTLTNWGTFVVSAPTR
jgi:hypothetical protein